MATAGWFGKLSCLGDFASRRLPPEWVGGCDDWLSRCLAHGQAQRGAAWLPAYLATPVWRFVWGPQVADERWWYGILMPSCDSVGRYFPLVLAQPRTAPPEDRFGYAHLELWWQHLAAAALDTLADGASVDAFEEALADAPDWPAAPPPGLRSMPLEGGRRWALPAALSMEELAPALATAGLRESLHGHSLWWPWVQDGAGSVCTMVPGLPTPAVFDGMLGPVSGR